VPALRPLSMDADPTCAKKHSGPVANEMLALGSGNTMGNILVWVSKGLPAGKAFPVPKTPVVLDQNGCQYKPHVMGIMVGQTYRILNSDGVLHNIHTSSLRPEAAANPPVNRAQPKFKTSMTETFRAAETLRVSCDVHRWMQGWIVVADHPYYAVTDAEGRFMLADVPPGDYQLDVWHETLGEMTKSVSVADGATSTVAAEMVPR